MPAVISPEAPPDLTAPPVNTDQIRQANDLLNQYHSLTQASQMLQVAGVLYSVSLSAPGFSGISFNGNLPSPQAAQGFQALLSVSLDAIAAQLKAAGITP